MQQWWHDQQLLLSALCPKLDLCFRMSVERIALRSLHLAAQLSC
jgi:hypothetical protein